MSSKVANIVNVDKFESQTSNISVDIFTPSASGMFRLSLYGELDSTGTVTVSFSDDIGVQSVVVSGSMNRKTANIVSRFAAGQPVHLTTDMDSFPYSLYLVIEKLD